MSELTKIAADLRKTGGTIGLVKAIGTIGSAMADLDRQLVNCEARIARIKNADEVRATVQPVAARQTEFGKLATSLNLRVAQKGHDA